MSAIVPFNFGDQPMRTVTVDDATWFALPDACMILEHSNPSRAAQRLHPDDVRRSDALTTSEGIHKTDNHVLVTDALGRPQVINWVNESGLYDLIFESRKPQARAFRRWVTSELLPQIRRTGQYVPESPPAPAHELEMGKPVQLTMGHSPVWITPHPDGKWTHATDVCFLFGFRDSDELAAWLPASERRREKVPWGVGGTLNLWVISEAGMRRLLAERQPAPYMNHGATLAHTAMKGWVASGLPALPPPKRHALES